MFTFAQEILFKPHLLLFHSNKQGDRQITKTLLNSFGLTNINRGGPIEMCVASIEQNTKIEADCNFFVLTAVLKPYIHLMYISKLTNC